MIRTLLQMRNAVPLEAKQQTLDILPVQWPPEETWDVNGLL